MPLLFNYLKMPDCFIGWNASFAKNQILNAENFSQSDNDCDGNKLDHNNDLPAIGNKNYALQKPFKTDFSTVIRYAKLQPSFVIC